jgi:hypothetical protein
MYATVNFTKPWKIRIRSDIDLVVCLSLSNTSETKTKCMKLVEGSKFAPGIAAWACNFRTRRLR